MKVKVISIHSSSFLAVQDSSIGDLVTQSLINSSFDFSDLREHYGAVVDTCDKDKDKGKDRDRDRDRDLDLV